MSLINCSLVIRRCCHFKFKPGLLSKQSTMLKRFNDDIETTMEKIKRKKKVKVTRGRAALTQTTSLLMSLANPQSFESQTSEQLESGISEGSPEQLVVRRDGMSRSFLTTRMKVLNTNFSRAVAEIFVADEELAKLLEEYQIRITQVSLMSFNFLFVSTSFLPPFTNRSASPQTSEAFTFSG